MSIGSTKSRDRKKQGAQETTQAQADIVLTELDAPEISQLAWRVASLTILAGAAFIRIYELGLVPMHHDEGVNGFFLTTLYRKGVYHYDPANYHGPTLYYFALVLTKLNGLLFGDAAGLNTIAVRLVPVIFGVATVWLALTLRRNIGTIGALAAAALIAISPGHVYISRYFIHEAHFVFFTLGIVVAALRYYETADPIYLLLSSLSAALLFATKETAIISVGVLLLALAVAQIYMRLTNGRSSATWEKVSKKKSKKRNVQREEPLARFGGLTNVAFWSSIALALFVFVNILFYSSFFTYWQGVGGAIESVQVWATTGTKEHAHPFTTYLAWLSQEESPLLLLGSFGAMIALIRHRNRFAVFAGAWAFGIFAAYSLIPYKTPWLMINFTVPLAIVGGYFINEAYNFDRSLKSHFVAIAMVAAALIVSGTQSVILNFYNYDDDRYPYVYAHTQRRFLDMVEEIERLANRAGTGTQTGITITSPDYWPLPWYLRNYEHAGFFGHMTTTDEPIVLGSTDQISELDSMLDGRYQLVDSYPLRPGVTLVLYAKKELIGQEPGNSP
ncbi:MAG TPA: flippase activity-associated protein Agl23 [Pyrinomonadaceae bacterium]|nr:flippase activity-associated protein Agl23 [Pyrinomonadaceae bacterium]